MTEQIIITVQQQHVIAALVLGCAFGALVGWLCGIKTGLRYAKEEQERAAQKEQSNGK
ncbi:MAG: hypothetical protein RR818_02390 [Citrobacter sp.]